MSNELYELLKIKLHTGHAYGDGKHFPVLHEKMKACVEKLRSTYRSAEEMDADRQNLEFAIAASRPHGSQYNTTSHVKARYRALRLKSWEEIDK